MGARAGYQETSTSVKREAAWGSNASLPRLDDRFQQRPAGTVESQDAIRIAADDE